jgi:ABC-type antimicrobial peptide transport system permease subunit
MNPLIALHLCLHSALLALPGRARTGLASRRRRLLEHDREAGLSTLEITIIALGLFLIAGIAVAVLTGATQNRLDQIQ